MTFEWPAVMAFCAVCTLLGAIGALIYGRATRDTTTAEIAKAAQITAAAANGKFDLLLSQLNAHQVTTAHTMGKFDALLGEYKSQVIGIETRFARAFEDMAEALKGMNERIDRVLEGIVAKRDA